MIKTNFAVLMAERGLKIADVYEMTGISKTTLMALADNTGKGIQFDTVDKICNALGVGLEDFFVYSPYIWNISYEDTGSTEDYRRRYLEVALKGNKKEKKIYLEVSFHTPNDYDFPAKENDFSLWISVYLEYSDETFWDFYMSLPVILENHFLNNITSVLKDKTLKIGTVPHVFEFSDRLVYRDINLKKGDKIYISFFNDGNKPSNNVESFKIITI